MLLSDNFKKVHMTWHVSDELRVSDELFLHQMIFKVTLTHKKFPNTQTK